MKVREYPSEVAFKVNKGLDSRGDPPRTKSVIHSEDRMSLKPSTAASSSMRQLSPLKIKPSKGYMRIESRSKSHFFDMA